MKYKVGDYVRVIVPGEDFDRIGLIDGNAMNTVGRVQDAELYMIAFTYTDMRPGHDSMTILNFYGPSEITAVTDDEAMLYKLSK